MNIQLLIRPVTPNVRNRAQCARVQKLWRCIIDPTTTTAAHRYKQETAEFSRLGSVTAKPAQKLKGKIFSQYPKHVNRHKVSETAAEYK